MKAWLVLGFLLLTEFLCVDCVQPLIFLTKPPAQIIAQAGTNLTVACKGDGSPPPLVSWRRIGSHKLDLKRTTINDGFLEIFNLNKSDHGVYDCSLRNLNAENYTTFTIEVQNTTPHAPERFIIRPALDYVDVLYTPGYDGGHKATHMTAYRNVNQNGKWITKALQSNDMMRYYKLKSAIRPLLPNTMYEVRIWSKNAIGDGDCSRSIRIKTTNTPLEERIVSHEKKIIAIGVVVGLIVFIAALAGSIYAVRKQIKKSDEKLIQDDDDEYTNEN